MADSSKNRLFNVTNVSTAIFYDTHAHLDYPDYALDLPEVIERARNAGIAKINSIGTDLASSRRAVQLAERFPNVFAVVGWHPANVNEAPPDIRNELRELAKHPKVVALGETGFDYHHLPSQKPEGKPAEDERYKQRQAELFRQHLEVAAETGLNCVIHQRDALEDTLSTLQPFAVACAECSIASPTMPRRCGGFWRWAVLVSFTGIATFKNGQNVRDTMAATPLDQFMLETDCPYLAPVPYRGKRCEPAYVKEISEVVAASQRLFTGRTKRRDLCHSGKVLSQNDGLKYPNFNIQPPEKFQKSIFNENCGDCLRFGA